MKTLYFFTTTLLIILTSGAFAKGDTDAERSRINYAIVRYVDAFSHGKTAGLSAVLDQDVKFTTTRGSVICNVGKSEMLNFLKNNRNIEQNCRTDYQIIEINACHAIVKVSMLYPGFTKVNFLNLSNTKDGWKITNVSSAFL